MSGDWNEQLERRADGLVPGYVGNNDQAAPAAAITGNLEAIVSGLAAARPAANSYKGWYFSTDTGALDHSDGAAWTAVQSGTSAPGTPVVRAFDFAYNTAGLLTGAALYTPTIDDWLLDAWIEVRTAWDGTTPIGDFGALIGGDVNGFLLYSGLSSGQDMTVADISNGAGRWPHGYTLNQGGKLGLMTMAASAAPSNNIRLMPTKFATADPVKVVVSQDGSAGGADPGATMGAATLYLVTATPA